MAELRILNHNGHDVLTWDRALEEAVNDVVTPADAKVAFDKMRSEGGYFAAKSDADGGNAEQIRVFDPDAAIITMYPPMVGG